MNAASEQAIRADERHKVAALLEQHADVIGDFAPDGLSAVRLVAYMLRLARDVEPEPERAAKSARPEVVAEFPCTEAGCGFVAKAKNGLSIHLGRAHKQPPPPTPIERIPFDPDTARARAAASA